MPQTKRKTKHRGNAAGSVTTRGRTGRPPSPSEKKKQTKEQARVARLNRRPTWKMMYQRAGLTSLFMFVILLVVTKGKGLPEAVALAVIAFVLYVPFGYYTEMWLWKRRMAKRAPPTKPIT
jgi:hypothetical protein